MTKKSATASMAEMLLDALQAVKRPGNFCTSGTAAPVLPGLNVDGVGPISLPLPETQAKELKRVCEQAGYGKGEETVVDTKVRRVWKLRAERFSIGNPEWAEFIGGIVANVKEELGLEGQKLEAHLYDLLLYEKGGFFLPHKDGERLEGMVATLIVMLPSVFTGGELVVRHEGKEQVIEFAGKDAGLQIKYAAFYADCEHEVKPLRSGYRLCLVYNLTLAKSKKVIGAPRNQEQVAKVADILRRWNEDAQAAQKLAVKLEHQYTQEGLAWDALKGVDRAKASVLAEAALQAGFHVYLALLTLWESGSAPYEGDYSYRHRRRYYDDSGEGRLHKMEELYDSGLSAEHWRGAAGERPTFGQVTVTPQEVVPRGSLKSVTPEENYEGYTGNEGLTVEHWYRHAVIMLWPAERHFDVMCASGARKAAPALIQEVKRWKDAPAKEAEAMKARCLQFAGRVLENWPAEEEKFRWSSEKEEKADPMPALRELGDSALIAKYIRKVLIKDSGVEPGKDFIEGLVQAGWATLHGDLLAMFKATRPQTLERNIRLLGRLCDVAFRSTKKAADGQHICKLLCDSLAAELPRLDGYTGDYEWRFRRIERAPMLTGLARSMLLAGADETLASVISHAMAHPNRYALREAHLAALMDLAKWPKKTAMRGSAALLRWIEQCRGQLEVLTAETPPPPADFARQGTVKCTCDDCKELNRFLRNRNEEQHHFQMAENRRRHVESNIHTYGCDVKCKTDRNPRPQVLICTKTTASHEARVKQYNDDVKSLAMLRDLEDSIP